MSSQPTIMKFGGTSLENEDAFKRVAAIVGNSAGDRVVVVSAMSGVTDALLASFRRCLKSDSAAALQELELHFERHLTIARMLGSSASRLMQTVIEESRREIAETLSDVSANRITIPEGQDAMVSHGERMAANLFTLVLEESGMPSAYVDARSCIITNRAHGNATPLVDETRRQTCAVIQPLLAVHRIPVLGGFVGSTKNRRTTTLGRGSSDYSATLLSAVLGARETQIWTDVDGVMTADPSLVRTARTVSQLSYREAATLAHLGARVIHLKMIEPVIKPQIPIRVLNSRNPDCRGTLIAGHAEPARRSIKAFAVKTRVNRIQITSTPAYVANGFLGAIKEIFARYHTHMAVVDRSEVGVTLACEDLEVLPSVLIDLQQVGSVETTGQRAVVSCVGHRLHDRDHSKEVLRHLSKLDPTLAWFSSSPISLSSTIDSTSVGQTINRIHHLSEPPA